MLRENIRNLRDRLAETTDAALRARLSAMVGAAERELALLEAADHGVRHVWEQETSEQLVAARADKLDWFRRELGDSDTLAALIDPAPGLVMVDVSNAYVQGTGVPREQIVGRPLFEAFPDNPDDPQADGIHNLYASLRAVSDTGREHAMPLQRYDVPDSDGHYRERYWRSLNSPVMDDDGRLIFLLLVVEDATADVLAGRAS